MKCMFGVSLFALILGAGCAERPWIIDTHTHFKGGDQVAAERSQRRWDPRNMLGHALAPRDYRPVADRLAIRSTLVVEACNQDRPQDNDWVLKQATSDLVCGYVAREDLTSDTFPDRHRRYRKSGFLKGYRFRREELRGYLADATAREHLRTLEQEGLVVDLLIRHDHADDVAQLARMYPSLKIVINHCLGARMKDGQVSDAWKTAVTSCAAFPNVYCKLSSILNFSEAKPFADPAPVDLDYYRPVLEHCFEAFGEDRVIFATNWPVCTHFGSTDDVVRIVTEFLRTKGEEALAKGMYRNAIRVYGLEQEHLR